MQPLHNFNFLPCHLISKAASFQGRAGEESSKQKEKEESVVVAEDYVAGFMDLRSRGSSAKGFSLSLSQEEIEKDFMLMTGKKPPQIPKKRKRSVQKRIKDLYLGTELKTVCTAEDYEVKVK